ncbi:MAG: hypothetical protein JOZ22_15375 [Acidobacteriia bacterium]|nr:hypothetical protein [Terriglobia bacterium]
MCSTRCGGAAILPTLWVGKGTWQLRVAEVDRVGKIARAHRKKRGLVAGDFAHPTQQAHHKFFAKIAAL